MIAKMIWIPRILLIMLIFFMLLMSIDVFGEGHSLRQQLIGFLMHNIPALILILILVLTWNYPLLAGILTWSCSVAMMIYLWPITNFPTYIIINSVPSLISILFIISYARSVRIP